MIAVADAGFRAIAPDFRGYGLSEIPAEPEKTTFKDLVDDILAILDLFHFQKVSNLAILCLIFSDMASCYDVQATYQN